MLRILHVRAKASVEIRVIGQVSGRPPFDVRRLAGTRGPRTIIRDGKQAFVGSQSLRAAELDLRREVGLVVREPKAVKTLIDTFESDWTRTAAAALQEPEDVADVGTATPAAASAAAVASAVDVFAGNCSRSP